MKKKNDRLSFGREFTFLESKTRGRAFGSSIEREVIATARKTHGHRSDDDYGQSCPLHIYTYTNIAAVLYLRKNDRIRHFILYDPLDVVKKKKKTPRTHPTYPPAPRLRSKRPFVCTIPSEKSVSFYFYDVNSRYYYFPSCPTTVYARGGFNDSTARVPITRYPNNDIDINVQECTSLDAEFTRYIKYCK